ncbi:MAG: hypothetical protein ACRDYD_02880, partial [Acidimicrobiales bacterium]
PEVNHPRALQQGIGSAGALHGQRMFEHLETDGSQLKNVHRSLVGGLTAHRLFAGARCTPAYAVGFGAFGPLLLGYVQWLHRAARRAGHDRLYFLARDGRIMLDAYRAFWGADALPGTYLLASRRLLNFPAIGERLTNRDVDFLTQTSWPIPVGEYFARLAVPEIDRAAGELLGRMGLDPEEPGGRHGAELRAVFWQLEKVLVAVAADERRRLLEYLEMAGLLAATHPAVVDIGWHGSLQRAVHRVLGYSRLERRLGGLYFGLHPQRPLDPAEPMQAFVDGTVPDDADLYERLVVGSVAALEFCFTRPEGTVVGLERQSVGDSARAVGSGALIGRHAADRLPVDDAEVLGQVQRGALDFVADFRRATDGMPGTVSILERDVAAESMALLLSAPTVLAADALGRRHHSDGFGTGVAWKLIGAPGHEAEWYARDLEQLTGELAGAAWRAGYVANARAVGLPAS